MRFICCSLFLLLTLPVAAAALQLERVWPAYRSGESFTRIGEYFGLKPESERRTIMRSQPDERAGYYWLVRTKTEAAITATRFELQVIMPGAIEAVTYTFKPPLPEGSHATLVGVTGADWPDPETRPVAWSLRIFDANDNELAADRSFLWSFPTDASPES